jgi:hypothetical protein
MEFETPQRNIEEIAIQGGVICAVERMFGRYERVLASIADIAQRHQIVTAGTPDFNDFFNMMLVRGLVAYAPVLTEEERQCGLVEALSENDIGLLRRTIAKELQALGEMLEVLEKNVPGKMAQRLAGRTLKDTAELLLTAAEMAAAKKLTIDN